MEILYYLFFFIIGIVLGSFYNVVGIRVSLEQSIVKPGSHCPNCKHELSWYENIPLISYLALRGRCKSCKEQISPIYFSFELITGLLFMFGYYYFGLNKELIVALTFISLFVIITVSDLKYMLIEDIVLLIFLVIILVERLFIPMPLKFMTVNSPYFETLLGGIVGFSLLFLIAYIGEKILKKEVMGGGDIKLYGIIGLVLGIKLTLLSLFIAAFLGSFIGVLLIRFKIIKKDTPIPFGPFIALGSLITYFYGVELLNWYTGLFSL